jgi:hypothetical protein
MIVRVNQNSLDSTESGVGSSWVRMTRLLGAGGAAAGSGVVHSQLLAAGSSARGCVGSAAGSCARGYWGWAVACGAVVGAGGRLRAVREAAG